MHYAAPKHHEAKPGFTLKNTEEVRMGIHNMPEQYATAQFIKTFPPLHKDDTVKRFAWAFTICPNSMPRHSSSKLFLPFTKMMELKNDTLHDSLSL
jgi:hypothetical protein